MGASIRARLFRGIVLYSLLSLAGRLVPFRRLACSGRPHPQIFGQQHAPLLRQGCPFPFSLWRVPNDARR